MQNLTKDKYLNYFIKTSQAATWSKKVLTYMTDHAEEQLI